MYDPFSGYLPGGGTPPWTHVIPSAARTANSVLRDFPSPAAPWNARRQPFGRPPVSTVLRIAVLGILLLISACPAMGEKNAYIQGQVRRTDGGPLPADVTVRLEEAEGVVIAV